MDHTGHALCKVGRAMANLGLLEDAIHLYGQALKEQRSVLGESHLAVANTLIGRGTALATVGLLYDSVLDLEKALLIQ